MKYNYLGEGFNLEFDFDIYEKNNVKRFLPSDRIVGMKATKKTIELYNQIKSNKKLYNDMNEIMKNSKQSFSFSTRKKCFSFQDYKWFWKQNIDNWSEAEEKFLSEEKDIIAGISFSNDIDHYNKNLEIKNQYFSLSKNLFKELIVRDHT